VYVPPVDKRKKELEQEVEELRKKLFEQAEIIKKLQKEIEELRLKHVKSEEKCSPPVANILRRGMYWIYEVLSPARVYVEKYHDLVEAKEQEERYFISNIKDDVILVSKEVFSTIKGGERYKQQFYYYILRDGRYCYLKENMKTELGEIRAGKEFMYELPEELISRLVFSDARTILWKDLSQNKEGDQVEISEELNQVVLYKFLGKEKRNYRIGEREVYHLHLPSEDKHVLKVYDMPSDLFYDSKTGLLLEDTNKKLKITNIPL
jgi:hypothetical protein